MSKPEFDYDALVAGLHLSAEEHANAAPEPSRYEPTKWPATDINGYPVYLTVLACKDCGAAIALPEIHNTRCPGREQTRIR